MHDMHDAHLSRQLHDLKSTAEARKAAGRAARPLVPQVLLRLDALEHAGAMVAGVLDDLADTLQGLVVSRRLSCGAWVLQASGLEPAADAEQFERRSWSRLEFRLAIDPESPRVLQIACRATACDADLPGNSAQVDLCTIAIADECVRAFAEQCSLEFARALLARRAWAAAGATG